MIDKKFKAVFWDFGGVITSSPFQAFSGFEIENNLPKDFIRKVNSTNPYGNAWAKLESSKISLEEFDKLFALESENLGFKIEGSQILELLQGSVVPEMVKMLEVLKEESFLLACLTNNFNANEDKSALDNNNQERQKILGLFDYIIESREVGVRKPENKFYEIALNTTGCNPAEVIFLDDLGINLKPAKALGMNTIKVVDHIESIKELCEYLEISSERVI
jgi:putative hydrolase of the HAD superfamily